VSVCLCLSVCIRLCVTMSLFVCLHAYMRVLRVCARALHILSVCLAAGPSICGVVCETLACEVQSFSGGPKLVTGLQKKTKISEGIIQARVIAISGIIAISDIDSIRGSFT